MLLQQLPRHYGMADDDRMIKAPTYSLLLLQHVAQRSNLTLVLAHP